ncbi:ABC transporter permease [Microbacterium sp. AGC85]
MLLIIAGVIPTPLPQFLRAGAVLAGVIVLAMLGASWLARRRGRHLDVGVVLSAAWLIVLGAAAAFADALPLSEGRDPSKTLLVPAMQPPDLFSAHPFGTDSQALDVLAQLLYGARVSLIVAGGAVLIALVVGGAVGVIAGYFRGKIEAVIGFITDTILAFPALILLLALVTVLQPTVINLTIALGILGVPGVVRLARASTLAISSREFVVASRTLGAGTSRILVREIVPNIIPPLVALGFVTAGFLLVAEASLSFLGLGIQRPNPTWGNLISQGQAKLHSDPWLVALPVVFLFLTVMASNYIGQQLQKKWSL